MNAAVRVGSTDSSSESAPLWWKFVLGDEPFKNQLAIITVDVIAGGAPYPCSHLCH